MAILLKGVCVTLSAANKEEDIHRCWELGSDPMT